MGYVGREAIHYTIVSPPCTGILPLCMHGILQGMYKDGRRGVYECTTPCPSTCVLHVIPCVGGSSLELFFKTGMVMKEEFV